MKARHGEPMLTFTKAEKQVFNKMITQSSKANDAVVVLYGLFTRGEYAKGDGWEYKELDEVDFPRRAAMIWLKEIIGASEKLAAMAVEFRDVVKETKP